MRWTCSAVWPLLYSWVRELHRFPLRQRDPPVRTAAVAPQLFEVPGQPEYVVSDFRVRITQEVGVKPVLRRMLLHSARSIGTISRHQQRMLLRVTRNQGNLSVCAPSE